MFNRIIVTSITLLCCFAFTAKASLIYITASEVDNDVIFNISGSVDLTGMRKLSTGNTNPILLTNNGYAVFAPNGGGLADTYSYQGSRLPQFSTGHSALTSHVGDIFGFSGYNPLGKYLKLTAGYQSLDAINTVATFSGESFASMQLTTGLINYTFANNTAVINIQATQVPEPTSLAVLSLGLLLLVQRKLTK